MNLRRPGVSNMSHDTDTIKRWLRPGAGAGLVSWLLADVSIVMCYNELYANSDAVR